MSEDKAMSNGEMAERATLPEIYARLRAVNGGGLLSPSVDEIRISGSTGRTINQPDAGIIFPLDLWPEHIDVKKYIAVANEKDIEEEPPVVAIEKTDSITNILLSSFGLNHKKNELVARELNAALSEENLQKQALEREKTAYAQNPGKGRIAVLKMLPLGLSQVTKKDGGGYIASLEGRSKFQQSCLAEGVVKYIQMAIHEDKQAPNFVPSALGLKISGVSYSTTPSVKITISDEIAEYIYEHRMDFEAKLINAVAALEKKRSQPVRSGR